MLRMSEKEKTIFGLIMANNAIREEPLLCSTNKHTLYSRFTCGNHTITEPCGLAVNRHGNKFLTDIFLANVFGMNFVVLQMSVPFWIQLNIGEKRSSSLLKTLASY